MISSSSKRLSLVISCNAKVNENQYLEITRDMLCDYLKGCDIPFFAFVKHESDSDTPYLHYHVVMILDNPKSCKSVIKDFCREFMISTSAVSCRVIRSLKNICLYLTHESESCTDKEKLPISSVITSNFEELCRYRVGVDILDLNINDLLDLIDSSYSLLDLYIALDVKASMKYRNILKDLWILRKGRSD